MTISVISTGDKSQALLILLGLLPTFRSEGNAKLVITNKNKDVLSPLSSWTP